MGFMGQLKISTRLWLSLGVTMLVLGAVTANGVRNLATSNAAIDGLYHQGLEQTARIAHILNRLGEMRGELAVALQHDPASPSFAQHNHDIGLHLQRIRDGIALVDRLWGEITARQSGAAERQVAEEFEAAYGRLLEDGLKPALAAVERADFAAVNTRMMKTIFTAQQAADAAAERFLALRQGDAAAMLADAEARHRTNSWVTLSLWGVALVVVGGLSWVTARSVGQSVKALETAATALGEGDLTVRVEVVGRDELARVATAFNRIAERFGGIVREVQLAIAQVASSADQASTVARHATDGMQRQQAESESVVTAMTEMTATVHDVARSAAEAAEAARAADLSTEEGRQVVRQSMQTVGQLATEVERASDVVSDLAQETANIGTVLDVIRGVAEQTNLLALNAAIEAARAGEQGRGFAVVADEVRTLASRTQQSTNEIHDMISRLQSGVGEAVAAMAKGRSQAKDGATEAQRAAQALDAIGEAVGRMSDMNTQIASAAEEQSAVAEEINRNVANISQVSEETATGAAQSAAASAELVRLAGSLQEITARLRTG